MASSTVPSVESTAATERLPEASQAQTYVSISAFPAGYITLPESAFISPADPHARRTVPSLAFLITHPSGVLTVPGKDQAEDVTVTSRDHGTPFKLMFDLGLRADPADYIPQLAEHLAARQPVTHRPSVKQTLQTGDIQADEIDAVVISHVHWDHHGDPDQFPSAKFIVGPGATKVLEHGLPGRGAHSHFDPKLFAECPQGYVEVASPSDDQLSSSLDGSEDGSVVSGKSNASESEHHSQGSRQWKQLGPFPATLDLFGDGSVYLINTPGHLPGHINLLCRTAEKKWVYLGGDAYHDKRLLTGEREIATWVDPCGSGMVLSFHIDREKAVQSIERIRQLIKIGEAGGDEVEVIVAHDDGWLKDNFQRLFPVTL